MAKRSKHEKRKSFKKWAGPVTVLEPVTSKRHVARTRNKKPYGAAMNLSTAIKFGPPTIMSEWMRKQCRRTPWRYQPGKPLTARQRRKSQRIAARNERIRTARPH